MMLSSVSFFTFSQEAPADTSEDIPSSAEAMADRQEEVSVEDVASPEETAPADQDTSSQEESFPEAAATSQETQEKASSSADATADTTADTSTDTQEAAPAEQTDETPSFAGAMADTVEVAAEEVVADEPAPIVQPALVEDQEIIIPEEETEKIEPSGIDTVSIEDPQGNWLFKRIWWERAEERYEKIRLMVDAIWESRTTFFIERNKLDRNVLDPFYINIGIDQGELQVILAEINDFFEKQREQQGELTDQERMLYESYATEEETLKQLKSDVESIANLDHAIDDALGTLMNQINRVRQFETQAWDNFKEIAHILNDTKARELYYMIEGAARNIKNISVYLEREFFTHFNKLIADATKHVNRVQSQIDALKEKGISFKRQTELLEEQNAKQQQEDDSDQDEDVKPKPQLGWFGWIGSLFTDALSSIWSILRMPYDMIFGK